MLYHLVLSHGLAILSKNVFLHLKWSGGYQMVLELGFQWSSKIALEMVFLRDLSPLCDNLRFGRLHENQVLGTQVLN